MRNSEPLEENTVVTTDPDNVVSQDATEWDGLYEDEQGYYTVGNDGQRNYAIDPDSKKVNRKATKLKNTQEQIDRVVNKMKEEGMWPQSEREYPDQSWKATRVVS